MKSFAKVLNNFEKTLVTLSMFLMVILIFLQVFSRYVMGDAIGWTEEASRYLFIWLIFLSIGISFIEKKHISIDIVLDRLPLGFQKAIQQFVYLLLLVLSVFLLVQGLDLIENMRSFNQKSATLQIPMWIVYSALPVGFLFSIIRIIQASILLYTGKASNNKEEDTII
ncbi:TRAP-type C4-dicarboxylate transport system, small permease component [Psychrobacillus psychrotolerans]|uniref:TRAP-type C4-dicarboxylate transport system, small permease component n=1 Tax=Psychrobacillus psychrotolerans TaxID=126156 RepID=A0A1I6ABG1_9BACI|nr:TRAP transporter small permease [Psychrobacillus psychrotolerans]SFQ66058.1 TRAP-type C4-dicarboxylate transport system, small permease component [Psychrobacillus psychrotolerans]